MDVVVDFAHVQGERGARGWPHPVSFQVQRGQMVLIRTKSDFSAPLFRLCLGFSEPASGTVTVMGKAPWALGRSGIRDLRCSVGCVLDPDGLVANMSVRQNLVVPLVYATGLHLDDAEARADRMLETLHLTIWSASRPSSLPAEVRQAVALARALCPRPSLLLLENPVASVDNRETRRLMSLCRAQGESLLVATQRNDDILDGFADAVWEWNEDGFIAGRALHEVG